MVNFGLVMGFLLSNADFDDGIVFGFVVKSFMKERIGAMECRFWNNEIDGCLF